VGTRDISKTPRSTIHRLAHQSSCETSLNEFLYYRYSLTGSAIAEVLLAADHEIVEHNRLGKNSAAGVWGSILSRQPHTSDLGHERLSMVLLAGKGTLPVLGPT
jgi:hypothetical protein